MSNVFTKNLPWIAPTVAILGVGAVGLDRLGGLNGVAQMGQGAGGVADPAPVAAQPVAQSAPNENDVAERLAALLEHSATTVETTRNQGFAVADVTPVPDAPAAPVVAASAPEPEPTAITADFFTAAQADLTQATQCLEDLRNLASHARVHFPSGGVAASAQGIEQARLLGVLAAQCPGVMIRVEGHSDPSGDPAANMRLSERRAQAVLTRLAASGADMALFTAVGMGDTVPSNETGPQDEAFYDRRVEFSVIEIAGGAAVQTQFGFGAAGGTSSVCAQQLETAVQTATISYDPHGVLPDPEQLSVAAHLAEIATGCPQARLRLIGHHSSDASVRENSGTGRLRAVVLMSELVDAGFPANQLILAAPSDARPVAGRADSRVDFDIIHEDM